MSNYLFHDYETRSRIDLKDRALAVYSRDVSTRPLMLSWALNDDPVKLWLPHESLIPAELEDALADDRTIKVAHNAPFEHAITEHALLLPTPIQSYRCTQMMANSLSLPSDLHTLSRVIGLPAEQQKMDEGKRLIKKFCGPRKPTKVKPWEWADWATDPEDWALFCKYCIIDTEAEREVFKRLSKFPIPAKEYKLWFLDHKINTRGVPVDLDFVEKALEIAEKEKDLLTHKMRVLTGVANPGSTPQLLPWLKEHNYPFNDLQKDHVKRALADFTDGLGDITMTPEAIECCELRLQAARTSPTKYAAMLRANVDSLLMFMFQFGGASRTNRWGGRIVQLHNLPRPDKAVKKRLELARELILKGDHEGLQREFGVVMDVIASSIRSAIGPRKGKRMMVVDLAQIEVRVLAWLTGCKLMLEEFAQGLDTYKAFAQHIFFKPYDEVTDEERNISKPGKLGCGYYLGAGKQKGRYPDTEKTGLWGYAENMGIKITREQSAKAVKTYRETYREVPDFWHDIEAACRELIKTQKPQTVGKIKMDIMQPFMRIHLPSGRCLYYLRPQIEEIMFPTEVEEWREVNGAFDEDTGKWVDFGEVRRIKVTVEKMKPKLSITYEGYNDNKFWDRIITYSGKLTENIVQAIARDKLADDMLLADEEGYEIFLHVHDEIGAEVDENSELSFKDLEHLMAQPPAWAPDMPMGAEGYEAAFYRK